MKARTTLFFILLASFAFAASLLPLPPELTVTEEQEPSRRVNLGENISWIYSVANTSTQQYDCVWKTQLRVLDNGRFVTNILSLASCFTNSVMPHSTNRVNVSFVPEEYAVATGVKTSVDMTLEIDATFDVLSPSARWGVDERVVVRVPSLLLSVANADSLFVGQSVIAQVSWQNPMGIPLNNVNVEFIGYDLFLSNSWDSASAVVPVGTVASNGTVSASMSYVPIRPGEGSFRAFIYADEIKKVKGNDVELTVSVQ